MIIDRIDSRIQLLLKPRNIRLVGFGGQDLILFIKSIRNQLQSCAHNLTNDTSDNLLNILLNQRLVWVPIFLHSLILNLPETEIMKFSLNFVVILQGVQTNLNGTACVLKGLLNDYFYGVVPISASKCTFGNIPEQSY